MVTKQLDMWPQPWMWATYVLEFAQHSVYMQDRECAYDLQMHQLVICDYLYKHETHL